ncbi:MAG TPA: rhodanese-like domain-containing protein [Ferruginibacter sp.]|nr:rhodanese-like domain-containing protein [Ferruginibacter sp.]
MNIFQSIFGNSSNVDLKSLVDDGAFLVDVRTPGEFAGGHVKGSVNIPLDMLPAQLDAFRNKKHIIVFCRSGSRSAQAKTFLEQQGIQDVTNGGAWDYVQQFV